RSCGGSTWRRLPCWCAHGIAIRSRNQIKSTENVALHFRENPTSHKAKSRTYATSTRANCRRSVRAMASDFEQYGVSATKRVRSRYPAIYLKICAMMLPKEIQVKEDAIGRLSDEQLDEYLQIVRDLVEAKRAELNIRARGEPIDVTPAESKPKKGLRPVLIDESKDEGSFPNLS